LGQICYLLCFDNDPFCLSYNPFLLITIWIAYVWNRHFASSLPLFCSFFDSFAVRGNSSSYFSTASALFARTTGVAPKSVLRPSLPSSSCAILLFHSQKVSAA